MLIVRAPVRISFGGGGTDLPAYSDRFGGLVVSTTINKYFYLIARPSTFDGVQIISSDYGNFLRQHAYEDLFWDGDLALPKAILHHFDLRRGADLFLASEVPPGTGLGSSSAVAAALIKGVALWQGQNLSAAQVADLACQIEIEKMGMPIGRQDQYAAAFGGLNTIYFDPQGTRVQPLAVDPIVKTQLESRLMLFFTGSSRSSSSILKEQRAATRENAAVTEALHAIKRMAYAVRETLLAGDLDTFGGLLDAAWQQKKRLASKISNPLIDQSYAAARALGALGGKVTGAGGGGFLMLYAHAEYQPAITAALQGLGLQRLDFAFETEGTRVVLDQRAPALTWPAPRRLEEAYGA